MSDHAQILVQIDPFPLDARQRMVGLVTKFLLAREIIAPLLPPEQPLFVDDDLAWTCWGPGRRSGAPPNWGSRVAISADISGQSSMGNGCPWRCPQCGVELDSSKLENAWFSSHEEPKAQCQSCGWEARLGDWPNQWAETLVGGPVVRFQSWEELDQSLVDELKRMLGGGRCRCLWERI